MSTKSSSDNGILRFLKRNFGLAIRIRYPRCTNQADRQRDPINSIIIRALFTACPAWQLLKNT